MAAPEPPTTADDWIFQPDPSVTGPAFVGAASTCAGAASPAYPVPAGRTARHMAPTVTRAILRRTMPPGSVLQRLANCLTDGSNAIDGRCGGSTGRAPRSGRVQRPVLGPSRNEE